MKLLGKILACFCFIFAYGSMIGGLCFFVYSTWDTNDEIAILFSCVGIGIIMIIIIACAATVNSILKHGF